MAPDKPLLLHGDCMELLSTLPEHSVDFICCDPPYGITTAPWDKGLDWTNAWKELNRVCTPNGVVALFASNRFSFELYNTNPACWRYKWIWVKPKGTDFLNSRLKPLNNTEDILVFYTGKPGKTWYEPQKTYGHSKQIYLRRKGSKTPCIWGGGERSFAHSTCK